MSWIKPKLDKYWRNYDFCCVDVETTGLDLINDEVISVGAVAIIDGRISKDGHFYEEISPIKKPSVSSIEVHGLRDGDLEFARPVMEVIPDLITQMRGNYLVTHAAWVERAFLSGPLKTSGYKFPKDVVDTAALARFSGYADQDSKHEPSLELLAKKLNLPVYAPHHALGDAMTTAVVFLALATAIERQLTQKSGEILTLQRLLNISK